MRNFPHCFLPTISWNTERGTLPTIRISRDGKDQAPRCATMRIIVAVAPLFAFASIASAAVACTTNAECAAIPCPVTSPRLCEQGRCFNGTCRFQICIARTQQCPVRLL